MSESFDAGNDASFGSRQEGGGSFFPVGCLMKNVRFILRILILGSLAVSLNTCGEGIEQPTSITVKPDNPIIPVGSTQQFTATGTFPVAPGGDITKFVTWSSSDTSVAVVNSNGLATALTVGTTTITATSGAVSESTTLTVTSATLSSIAITPANPSVPGGTTQQLTATGTFSDGTTHDITTQVTWSSSNPYVATVNSNGLATAIAIGTATTITATSGTVSGSTTFTVTSASQFSISLTPANPVISVATTQQFSATATSSDGTTQDITTQATWSSSNTTVAVVNNNGLAAALTTGTTTITATSGTVSGSTTLTVTSATLSSIAITPANPSVPGGTTQQLTATGTFSDGTTHDITTQVTWSSSNPFVAAVNSNGLATTAIGTGTATITATSGTVSGSTTLTVTSATLSSITITPANPSVPRGTTRQFTATGTFSDGTTHDIATQVTWSSSNTTVAVVNSNGLATALTAGTATITATSGTISANTTLTVT